MPLGVTAVMLPELGLDEQVRLCTSLGVTHYVYRPRIIPPDQRDQSYSNWGNHRFDLTPQRLLDEGKALRKHLTAAGMTPFCTLPSVHAGEQNLGLHLDGAVAGGCSRMRLNPRPYPRGVFDYGDYLKQTIDDYRWAVGEAKQRKIKLVIEMHSQNAAAGPGLVRAICEHFDPHDLGVILDLPNLAQEGFVQPNLAVSVLAPYIDHCHVGGCRRVQGDYDELGFRQPARLMCPLTESDVHFPSWLEAVSQLGRDVPLVIEDYTPEMPGPLRLETTVHAVERVMRVSER